MEGRLWNYLCYERQRHKTCGDSVFGYTQNLLFPTRFRFQGWSLLTKNTKKTTGTLRIVKQKSNTKTFTFVFMFENMSFLLGPDLWVIKSVEIEVSYTLGEQEKGPGIPHGTPRVVVSWFYCTYHMTVESSQCPHPHILLCSRHIRHHDIWSSRGDKRTDGGFILKLL